MVGRGGGDRTKSAVDSAQVIDSANGLWFFTPFISKFAGLPHSGTWGLEDLKWVRTAHFRTTDIALIVSPSQNEIAQMQKLGLDTPHRKRMNEEDPPLG
jgi:hypothetical protein